MGTKSSLLEFSSYIGISQQLIKAYDIVSGGRELTPKLHVDDDIREFELDRKDQKGNIFLTLIPGSSPLVTFTLATAFQIKGYNPIVLYNDGMLPIKPSLRYYSNGQKAIESQRYKIGKFEKNFNIEAHSLQEILGKNYTCDIDADMQSIGTVEYKNINISEYAIGSTRKYLQRYSLNPDDQRTLKSYQKFLTGAAILADATQQIINEFDIVAALVTEEAYIHGGVPIEVCSNENIEAYVRGNGYQYGKVSFGRASNRTPKTNFSDKKTVVKALATELSRFQKKRIQELMRRREYGQVVRTHYTTTNNQTSIGVDEDVTVGVFSHLLWDAALSPQQAIYDDLFEWLSDTIEVGSKMEDTHFVIKAHPAEAIKGTDQSLYDWISSKYKELPANFSLLPPDTDVNTYSLIQELDAGIIYASTVGLEMVFNAVPVVVGGYPPYHGFGVTYDPSTQEEYKKLISNVGNLECFEDMKTKAERFAYLLFISKCFDYPYSSVEYGQHIYISEDKILSNDNINHIANKILAGGEVIKHRS